MIVSAEARRIVAELMALDPPARNAWLRDAPPDWRREVFVAVEAELGSPYGLWRDDPVGFVNVALGESLWAHQVLVLESIRDHPRTVVPSAHGTGKTHTAARAVAWWVSCWPPGSAVVVTTATKWRQVRNLLWPQIRSIHRRNRLPGDCLQVEWKIDDIPIAWGYSPADHDETAFSGIHAPHVLVLVDEAGGISPLLGQSLEAAVSTEGAHICAIGNPPIDETGSPWMEARSNSDHWHTITIPASVTPNFTGEPTDLCRVHPDLPPHPISDHLVSQAWVQTVADDEGVDSAYYIARVEARFPRDVENKTIPITWLEEACENDDPDLSTWVRLGVDVAADGGDRFSIARAEGFTVRSVLSRRPPPGVTTFDLAGYVLEEIHAAEQLRRRLGSDRPIRVKVDALGLGMGVADTLAAWGSEGLHDAEIVSVKVSESPTSEHGQERFANQRAEMWWTGRELVQPQRGSGRQVLRLEVDEGVVRQLGAPKYRRNSSGRIVIESKVEMSKRGIRSPDDAEAVLLAVYEPHGEGDPDVFGASDLLR